MSDDMNPDDGPIALEEGTSRLQAAGIIIRTLREEQRITQEKLAIRAELSLQGLQLIESGENEFAPICAYFQLAKALGVGITSLFAMGAHDYQDVDEINRHIASAAHCVFRKQAEMDSPSPVLGFATPSRIPVIYGGKENKAELVVGMIIMPEGVGKGFVESLEQVVAVYLMTHYPTLEAEIDEIKQDLGEQ